MPLSFFQAIDAQNQEFVSDLMSELARHFGYDVPLISQEMIDDFQTFLSATNENTHEYTDEDMGFLDHLVFLMEQLKEQATLIHVLGQDISVISAETGDFSDVATKAMENQSDGTPRHLQKLAGNYAKKMDEFASKLGNLNSYYKESIPEMDLSFQYVVSFQYSESPEGDESLREFRAVLETVEGQIEGLQSAMSDCRDALDQQHNYERRLRRATRNTIHQINALVSNLDRTKEMFHRGKVTLARYLND